MKKKSLIAASIGLAIIIVFCVITASGTFSWIANEDFSLEFFAIDHISANVSDTLSFPAQEIKNIEISSSEGDITLYPGNSKQILVDLEKTGWGGTQAEAFEKAKSLEVTGTVENNTLFLKFSRPNKFYFITYQGGSNKIDMTLHIPSHISVKTALSNGDIYVEDIINPINLEGKFSDIFLTNVTGGGKIASRDGDISIKNFQADNEEISIQTEFGDIEVNGIQGGGTQISSRDGNIEITKLVTNSTLDISNKFGNISINDFTCRNLKILVRDGSTDLQKGEISGELSVDSEFGDIRISNVNAGRYSFEARDGDIDIDYVSGEVNANSKFGDFNISNGSNISLSVFLEDGSINFSGTLNPNSNQTIETRYGNVILTIPDDSDFNLLVETKFGEFKSEIPINITMGPDSPTTNDRDFKKWEGQINSGGSEISITSRDGDIYIESLEKNE